MAILTEVRRHVIAALISPVHVEYLAFPEPLTKINIISLVHLDRTFLED